MEAATLQIPEVLLAVATIQEVLLEIVIIQEVRLVAILAQEVPLAVTAIQGVPLGVTTIQEARSVVAILEVRSVVILVQGMHLVVTQIITQEVRLAVALLVVTIIQEVLLAVTQATTPGVRSVQPPAQEIRSAVIQTLIPEVHSLVVMQVTTIPLQPILEAPFLVLNQQLQLHHFLDQTLTIQTTQVVVCLETLQTTIPQIQALMLLDQTTLSTITTQQLQVPHYLEEQTNQLRLPFLEEIPIQLIQLIQALLRCLVVLAQQIQVPTTMLPALLV